MATETENTPRFRIFRGEDAPAYAETDCMEVVGLTELIEKKASGPLASVLPGFFVRHCAVLAFWIR